MEQIKGQCIYPLVLPPYREAFEALTRTVFEGATGELEFETTGLKGRHIWLETHAVPLRNDRGEIMALLGITRNITERKKAEETLNRSNENLLAIFEAAPFPLTVIEVAKRTVTYANPVALKMYAFGSLDEAVGKTVVDLYARPEQRTKVLELLARDNRIDNLELEMRTATGKTMWVVVSARVISFNGEESILVAQFDITDRKKAEEALKESRETVFALINAITESVLLLELDGTVAMLNATTAERFGSQWEAIIGANIYDFLSPDVASARREKLSQVIETGKPINFEDVRSGRNILNSIYPLLDERGKVRRLAVFGYDITERKLAEEELSKSEAFLHNIIENIPAMLFVKDAAELRFVRFNKAGEDLLGYSMEELLGKNDYDFFPKEEADFFTAKDREVLAG
ncbi:MAG: PAS domain-containing protein, partial [Syntrophales bacterium LBB04]|nr:PAS domain-containing protein [Syntrophales bacterium LBB04]